MPEDKNSAGNRPWSRKVDPKRAEFEEGQARQQQDIENVFAEIFGAPDAGLMAELQDSLNRVSEIGNAMLAEAEEVRAKATQPESEEV